MVVILHENPTPYRREWAAGRGLRGATRCRNKTLEREVNGVGIQSRERASGAQREREPRLVVWLGCGCLPGAEGAGVVGAGVVTGGCAEGGAVGEGEVETGEPLPEPLSSPP